MLVQEFLVVENVIQLKDPIFSEDEGVISIKEDEEEEDDEDDEDEDEEEGDMDTE